MRFNCSRTGLDEIAPKEIKNHSPENLFAFCGAVKSSFAKRSICCWRPSPRLGMRLTSKSAFWDAVPICKGLAIWRNNWVCRNTASFFCVASLAGSPGTVGMG